MPKYSTISAHRLSTTDFSLQVIFNEVIHFVDCSILCGHRIESEQDRAFEMGNSKLKFPNSKHNATPSRAVDVAPYPYNEKDLGAYYMLAGYVKRVAYEMGILIRWGGDWDGDWQTKDQNFNDLAHYEIL